MPTYRITKDKKRIEDVAKAACAKIVSLVFQGTDIVIEASSELTDDEMTAVLREVEKANRGLFLEG